MFDEADTPIFELRQYQIFPGQLDRWVEWMDTIAIPFLESIGMTIVGSWSVYETNSYIWIRRFESESDRKRLTELQYENCLLYTSPSPRDRQKSRMPSSA